ncbi:hypothetical protein D3C73_865620 [compost metagenome]
MLKVGVEQHAIVDDETGVAVEGFDQRFLAVAGTGQGAVERDQTFDGWFFALAFEDFFRRYAADLRLHVQHWRLLAHIEGALGFEVTFVEIAAQARQRQQSALAIGLEYRVMDRQFFQGQLAEGQVSVHIQLAQAFHRQQAFVAPRFFGRGLRQRCAAGAGHGIGFGAGDFGLTHLFGAVGFG